jgi:colanic acid biosynthesis glycosyl transferase WcaI
LVTQQSLLKKEKLNKITIITGYYYPEDTAIGLYNTQMVEYLESIGHEVTVITGFPSYPQWRIRDDYKNKSTFFTEKNNKAKIFRYKQYVPSNPTFFKRILLLLDFTFGAFINTFKIKECDIVISIVPHTSTLFLGWVLKKRKKAKLWNHIQDFEFDAAHETGLSNKNKVIKNSIFKILFKLETLLLNKGDLNSTISLNMLEKLKKKSQKESFYFPNWIDADIINPSKLNTHKYLNSSVFKILYSGNIGDKQDWEFFLLFAKRIESFEVEIIVVGDGAKKDWLIGKLKDYKNVKYYSPIKYSELPSLLCGADLHILFQKNDVIDSVMPSKLLGMMASTKPSLVTGNKASEVKGVINLSKGGVFVDNNDVDKCLQFLKTLMENPKKRDELGLNARRYVVKNYSKAKVLLNFEHKLVQIIKN